MSSGILRKTHSVVSASVKISGLYRIATHSERLQKKSERVRVYLTRPDRKRQIVTEPLLKRPRRLGLLQGRRKYAQLPGQ